MKRWILFRLASPAVFRGSPKHDNMMTTISSESPIWQSFALDPSTAGACGTAESRLASVLSPYDLLKINHLAAGTLDRRAESMFNESHDSPDSGRNGARWRIFKGTVRWKIL